MENQISKTAEFNGRNEEKGIENAMQQERASNPGAFSKTENEMSIGDSERNEGDVNGTTFGPQSSTAKFSNLGAGNEGSQANTESNLVGNNNNAAGEGSIEYADYLNKADQQFISGTLDENA